MSNVYAQVIHLNCQLIFTLLVLSYHYAKNVYHESAYRNIIGFCIVSIIVYQEELYNATVNNFFVIVRFIGGRNRSILRKPPICYKSLTNFITQVAPSTPRHERDSNS